MTMDDIMPPQPTLATAVLGGGCFWCLDAVFRELEGIHSVESGYAGGETAKPTYEQVCAGDTGHAEVVRVGFDPAVITFPDLLRVFFTIHDPTTRDRQGHDVGPQYRSIVLAHDEAQAAAARAMIAEIEAAKIWPAPIVTEVVRLVKFWPAEREHEDYFARNPQNPYCQAVVAPKVVKFRKSFADRLKARAA